MTEITDLQNEIARLTAENEMLRNKTCVKYPLETPLGILQMLGEKTYREENDSCAWKDSPLGCLDKLKNDCSGKVGELLIAELCKNGDIPYSYKCDINSTDGTYDIMIKDKKVEIKTAKLGKQKGFQHESLRSDGYDYLLFLDVCPTYYYITIMQKFDLTTKSDILSRKAHLRKGTSDVFKLDFNEKILQTLIPKGHTVLVSDSTNIASVVAFIYDTII